MPILRQNLAIVTDVRAQSLVLVTSHGELLCRQHALFVHVLFDEATGALALVDYRVRAIHNDGEIYPMRYDTRRDDAVCSCTAGRANCACWHRGVVLLLARELRRRVGG